MKLIGRHVSGHEMGILIWALGVLKLVSASRQIVPNCDATTCQTMTPATLKSFRDQQLPKVINVNLKNVTQSPGSEFNFRKATLGNVTKHCAKHLDFVTKRYNSFIAQYNTIREDISERIHRLKKVWPDSFDQCLSFRAPTSSSSVNSKIRGQYCIAYFLPPLDQMNEEQVDVLKGLHRLTRHPHPNPETGLCIPHSCTAEDVQNYLKILLRESATNYTIVVPPNYCQMDQARPIPLVTKIVTAVILLIVVTAIAGTVLEVSAFMKQNTKSKDGSKQENETATNSVAQKDSFGRSILKCFSLFSNSWYLFKMDTTNPGEIDVFNGIRFVSALGCQSIHILILASHNGWNNTNEDEAPFLNALTVRGFYYIQLLLQTSVGISGVGIAMSALHRIRVKDKGFYIISFYLRRLWRLSVPYYMVIALVVGVVPYIGSGPKWPSVERTVDICKNYWLANVFYFNNYTNPICLFQTWYLSADVQLLLLAPVVILAFNRSARMGLAVAGALASFSVAKIFYMAYFHSLNAWNAGTHSNIETVESYFWNLYFLLHSRLGCYCIGIAFGYLIYTHGTAIPFDKPIHRFLPSVAVIFILSPFWLWYRYHHHETLPVTDLEAALCEAFCRIFFTASCAYMGACLHAGRQDGVTRTFRVIFCQKFFVFTAKLSYAVFLLHATILEIFLGTRPQAMEFSGFQMLKVVFGTLFITHLAAIPLTLLVVFPAARIERVFEDRLKRKRIEAEVKLSKKS